jgi:2-iminobutanoate/2-iminopropanoate deaminase
VQFKNSSDISSPAGYSHAVVVNGGKIVFLSGQVGLDKHGEMVGKDDFHAQVAQAFSNLRSALAAAGATPNDLVKLNYYVVGLNHDKLVAIRDVRDQMINKEHPPASTLAGVQALFREDALIEVEAVAVIP